MCRMSRHQEMSSGKSDLLQGTLDLLILHVAALGPLHGYAIAQRLQYISRDALQVQQGSLYPALHRLEQRGLLRAEWQTTDTGREAKFYSLTRTGRKQLDVERTNWERLAQAIALVLQTGE
jgi:PadR family transcriptional regulator PadR